MSNSIDTPVVAPALASPRLDPLQDPPCNCLLSDVSTRESQQRLGWVLASLLVLLLGEVGLGWRSGSLTLLAEAEHLLSDLGSLALTLVASWLAQQPAQGRATFGWKRVEVLAALANGLALLAIAALIAVEALSRLQSPPPVLSQPMLLGALCGLVVNGLNLTLLHRHSQQNLNLRGFFLHLCTDVCSSAGTLVAGGCIYFWGWAWADPGASLVVASLTAWSARSLIASSLDILLERAPTSLDPAAVVATLEDFTAVEQVVNCHLWSISSQEVMLCADVIVRVEGRERDRLLQQLQATLAAHFGLQRPILQLRSRVTTETIALHPEFKKDLASMFAGKHGFIQAK